MSTVTGKTSQIRNAATGEMRDHAGGEIIPDGWGPANVSFLLMDGGSGGATAATLGHARRILGDGYDVAAFKGLSDQAAQHLAVSKRLGVAAAGRPVSFLDAAWSALAGTGSSPGAAADPMPRMTEAQRAIASKGVERALADHGNRQGVQLVADTGLQAGRDAAHGAHDARTHALAQSWKSPELVAHEMAYDEALRAGGGDGKAAYRARCAMLTTAWQRGAA